MARKPVKVLFTHRAASEVADAKAWWSKNRPAAADAIAEDLARALQLLAVQPSIGATATNSRLEGVRRILLERVGYHVYYRIGTRPRVITILAFWHAARGSAPGI